MTDLREMIGGSRLVEAPVVFNPLTATRGGGRVRGDLSGRRNARLCPVRARGEFNADPNRELKAITADGAPKKGVVFCRHAPAK